MEVLTSLFTDVQDNIVLLGLKACLLHFNGVFPDGHGLEGIEPRPVGRQNTDVSCFLVDCCHPGVRVCGTRCVCDKAAQARGVYLRMCSQRCSAHQDHGGAPQPGTSLLFSASQNVTSTEFCSFNLSEEA